MTVNSVSRLYTECDWVEAVRQGRDYPWRKMKAREE